MPPKAVNKRGKYETNENGIRLLFICDGAHNL